MQIVIDIDEETLQDLYDSRYVSSHIKDVFRSATPLQKGHGRLIDADALKTEWKNGFHKKIVDALMDDAPTIIEAESHRIVDLKEEFKRL